MNNPELLDPELADGIPATPSPDERERTAELSAWGISLAAHALVALILMSVVVAARLVEIRAPTSPIAFDPQTEPIDDPQGPPDVRDVPIEFVHDEKVNAD
jgi:hypothetical protein